MVTDAWTALQPTQYLIFEIVNTCNLANEHRNFCPAAQSRRYSHVATTRPLDDAEIIACSRQAVELGFRGLIGWHYYCEPMLAWERLRELIPAIASQLASRIGGFTLWTNGHNLETLSTAELQLFRQIIVTNYHGQDWNWLIQKAEGVSVEIHPVAFDRRLRHCGRGDQAPCYRVFNEFVIDYYGNGHLCCWDWQGRSQLGNIRDAAGFISVAHNFQLAREEAAGLTAATRRTIVCHGCNGKEPALQLYPPVYAEICSYLRQHGCDPANPAYAQHT